MAIQTFTSGQTLTAAQMNSLQTNDYNQTVSAKTTSYTLVAGDVGTHIQMTASTATTISVPAATFAAGDSLFISSQGAGAVSIAAASTAITVTGSSTSLAQYGGGTLRFQSPSAATFFKQGGGTGYGVATGGIGAAQSTGTLADGFSYNYLTFNSTGTLTVTTAGNFDFCAVGAGGGGQNPGNASWSTSGGGAGQIIFGSIYLSANQTITIGAGSGVASGAGKFIQASNTTIAATAPFAVTANGNICCEISNAATGVYVGGGFGSCISQTSQTITASDTNGYQGGNAGGSTNAAGGGGSRALGGNSSGTTGGVGGAGVDVSVFIGGSALFKAMGGSGGGSGTGGAAATNGVAGTTNTTLNNGNANSGGGGGGGHGIPTSGGQGGSGIVFIRFR